MNKYRLAIWEKAQEIADRYLVAGSSLLDFGSGDGWFTQQWRSHKKVGRVSPVDVFLRERILVEPTIYDGNTLPFADRSFECVWACDVLHHCPTPELALREIARCSKRYILIKDHVSGGVLDRGVLAVLDELGNRRFSIPSPQNYQAGWSWDETLLDQGFAMAERHWPLSCHSGALGALTNRLQYVSMYELAR